MTILKLLELQPGNMIQGCCERNIEDEELGFYSLSCTDWGDVWINWRDHHQSTAEPVVQVSSDLLDAILAAELTERFPGITFDVRSEW